MDYDADAVVRFVQEDFTDGLVLVIDQDCRRLRVLEPRERPLTDETVKVCAYNFLESAISAGNQAIIEHRLRTI